MILKNGNVEYIQYEIFENFDFIKHASSTRVGGVSNTDYLSSMNLGFKTDDTKENVVKNYEIFCGALNIDINDIVFSSQFHNDNIKIATKIDRGKGITKSLDYEDVDALITNETNVALTVFSADCVPILYVDSKNKVIGAAHCGWRGTFKGLAAKVIKKMQDKFNTNPDDVYVAICPAIKSCCYEVSKELYIDFISKFDNIENTECAFIKNGKYYLDLQYINKKELEKTGVKNIEVSSLCTSCNSDYLFSHRKSGGKRGIMAHIIELI
ncbi:MAG: peptidoglycan editing factor PgeF [Ruminococcaceae bacterium]|nr:peptidoglycan editing factor PgeF [Oscillospiraceae bacterium]